MLYHIKLILVIQITDFALGVAGRRIRYEPLQSEAGRKLLRRSGRAPDDISSVVLVEKDRYIFGGDFLNLYILFLTQLR